MIGCLPTQAIAFEWKPGFIWMTWRTAEYLVNSNISFGRCTSLVLMYSWETLCKPSYSLPSRSYMCSYVVYTYCIALHGGRACRCCQLAAAAAAAAAIRSVRYRYGRPVDQIAIKAAPLWMWILELIVVAIAPLMYSSRHGYTSVTLFIRHCNSATHSSRCTPCIYQTVYCKYACTLRVLYWSLTDSSSCLTVYAFPYFARSVILTAMRPIRRLWSTISVPSVAVRSSFHWLW